MSIETTRLRLDTVQALRGIAATLVVLFHAAAIWREMSGVDAYPGPWDRGWAGVDLFFVISGFIMVWISADRPTGAQRSAAFLRDRAVRVFPLWWLYCAVMALYFLVSYGQPAAPGAQTPGGAVGHLLLSMALWPMGQLPVLGVGWTLTFELGFYALFAVFLLAPKRLWAVFFAVWTALIVWAWPSGNNGLPESWIGVWLDPICLQFVLGAAAAWIVRRVELGRGAAWICTLIGGGAFLALLVGGAGIEAFWSHAVRTVWFGPAGALLVIGVVSLERRGALSMPAWLRTLGDASYTLYLAHFIGLLVVARLCGAVGLFDAPSPWAMAGFMALGTAGSLVGSVFAWRWIERPLLRLTQRKRTTAKG